MRRILFLSIILILLAFPLHLKADFSDLPPSDRALLDSLERRVAQSYGTTQGLFDVDLLIATASRLDAEPSLLAGYRFKAANYFNLGMHGRLEYFADSLINKSSLRYSSPDSYYFVLSLLSQDYTKQGKYRLAIDLAMQIYQQSADFDQLDLQSLTPDGLRIPLALNNRFVALQNMGMTYFEMRNYLQAIAYYDEAINVASNLPDAFAQQLVSVKCLAAQAALRLDDIQLQQTRLDDLRLALSLFDRLDSVNGNLSAHADPCISQRCYMFIGYSQFFSATQNLPLAWRNLRDAEKFVRSSPMVAELLQDDFFEAAAAYFAKAGDLQRALAYVDSAINVIDPLHLNDLTHATRIKLRLNHLAGRYEHDFLIANELFNLVDSSFRFSNNAAVNEMNTIMGMDKLQMVTREIQQQRSDLIVMLVLVFAAAVFAILAVILFHKRRRQQERNRLLSQQNDVLESEVARKTKELIDRNNDITSSIAYAQKIQNAMLPDLDLVFDGSGFQGAFSFFRPCNIVSGDFYWAVRRGHKIMLACADCTGHGVPGGFMSMIGSTMLNEICIQYANAQPSIILEILDAQLLTALAHDDNGDVKDGMDMTLLVIDQSSMTASFASARHSLFLVRNGELLEFKGSKRSIGERDEVIRSTAFRTTSIDIHPDDTIYLCSDGIADQFGGQSSDGASGKRLRSTGLKFLLMNLYALPLDQQSDAAANFFDDWKGACPQTDDVVLLGIRF